MKLPQGDRAIVDIRKLRDYCLDPDHFRGRHKARVFRSALGFTAADAPQLREALLAAAEGDDIVEVGEHTHGERFVIDSLLDGPAGRAWVRSIWLVRDDDGLPHLVTCYVR